MLKPKQTLKLPAELTQKNFKLDSDELLNLQSNPVAEYKTKLNINIIKNIKNKSETINNSPNQKLEINKSKIIILLPLLKKKVVLKSKFTKQIQKHIIKV